MIDPIDLTAIIPMKPMATAKSRLADQLSQLDRESLVSNMLRHVIQVIRETGITEILVIGGCGEINSVASQMGAKWIGDENFPELNAAVNHGIEIAFQSGKHAVFIPGDLPLIRSTDLLDALRLSRNPNDVVLVPESNGEGTNLILLWNETAFKPMLGPESFKNHCDQAKKLGIAPKILENHRIGLDIDSLQDLEMCEGIQPGFLSKILERFESLTSN
jgi:2-phospho-L-lactate guanylyltransferase